VWVVFEYPIERGNWKLRLPLHLFAALTFTVVHVILADPIDPLWDPKHQRYLHIITWAPASSHALILRWDLLGKLILYYASSDVLGVYVVVALVGHMVWYYRRMRDREIHSSRLENQVTKARLRTLKSQLHPHFLFNALHSISSLMLTDVALADRMMSRLSDLLRLTLENTDLQLTTVKHELEFVCAYLDIEKMRYADRLTIVLDIAPETLGAAVPHLLLQPLVENAVRHGIGKMSSGGRVRISTETHDSSLIIEVEDNGPGITSTLEVHGHGIGLTTTRDRLQTLYNDHQNLEIGRGLDNGTLVRIEIPLQVASDSAGLASDETWLKGLGAMWAPQVPASLMPDAGRSKKESS